MKTDKEKLIEWIGEIVVPYFAERIADDLISKGVVIPVRCVECKYSIPPSKQTQIYGEKGTLTCRNKIAPTNHRNVNENDFCSYGERKDDVPDIKDGNSSENPNSWKDFMMRTFLGREI